MDANHKGLEFEDLSAESHSLSVSASDAIGCEQRRIKVCQKARRKQKRNKRKPYLLKRKWHSSFHKRSRSVFANKENEEIIEDDDSQDAMEFEDIWGSTDVSLDYKAKKSKLSTRNVKTIIKEVISNEHVIKMLRNTMLAEKGEEANLEEAEFVPRLTRSKVKDLERTSQFPQPGDSPVKLKDGTVTSVRLLMAKSHDNKSTSDDDCSQHETEALTPHSNEASPVKQSPDDMIPVDLLLGELTDDMIPMDLLLGEELSDNDSSDKEYEPVDEVEDESEEEEENSVILPASEDVADSSISLPKAPSLESSAPDGINKESSLVIVEPSLNTTEESDNQVSEIALRTRSKLPLHDTLLEELEAALIAPDISVDMYDTECDDQEWMKFLQDLVKPIDSTAETEPSKLQDEDDDGEGDPDYNFLEEEENMSQEVAEDLVWDKRNDRAVEVPQKEVRELIKEVDEDPEPGFFRYVDEQPSDDDVERSTESSLEIPPWSPSKDKFLYPENCFQLLAQSMTGTEKLQLQEQMRMHVQLLCQTYLLSVSKPVYQQYGSYARVMLEELSSFSERVLPNRNVSFFSAHNLHGALEIVNELSVRCIKRKCCGKEMRKCGVGSNDLKEVMAHNKTFIYPDLLPCGAYFAHGPTTRWSMFTVAEDNLLALGLEELASYSPALHKCSVISHLLLPVKNARQIKHRIKTAGFWKDNPLHYYFLNNRAPPLPRSIRPFDPNDVKPPAEVSPDLLPFWMVKYLEKKAGRLTPKQPRNREGICRPIRPKRQLPVFFKYNMRQYVHLRNSVQTPRNHLPTSLQASDQVHVVANFESQAPSTDKLVEVEPDQSLSESSRNEKQCSPLPNDSRCDSLSLRERSPVIMSKELYSGKNASSCSDSEDELLSQKTSGSLHTQSNVPTNSSQQTTVQDENSLHTCCLDEEPFQPKLKNKCRLDDINKKKLDFGGELSDTGSSNADEPSPKRFRSTKTQNKKRSTLSRQKDVQNRSHLPMKRSKRQKLDDSKKQELYSGKNASSCSDSEDELLSQKSSGSLHTQSNVPTNSSQQTTVQDENSLHTCCLDEEPFQTKLKNKRRLDDINKKKLDFGGELSDTSSSNADEPSPKRFRSTKTQNKKRSTLSRQKDVQNRSHLPMKRSKRQKLDDSKKQELYSGKNSSSCSDSEDELLSQKSSGSLHTQSNVPTNSSQQTTVQDENSLHTCCLDEEPFQPKLKNKRRLDDINKKKLDFGGELSDTGSSNADEPSPKRFRSTKTQNKKRSTLSRQKDVQNRSHLPMKHSKRQKLDDSKKQELYSGKISSSCSDSEDELLPQKSSGSLHTQSNVPTNSSQQTTVQDENSLHSCCLEEVPFQPKLKNKRRLDDINKKTEENSEELANKYVIEVVEVLKKEPGKLEAFLQTLASFEEDKESYDELYELMKDILYGYPSLLQRFALFKPEKKYCG